MKFMLKLKELYSFSSALTKVMKGCDIRNREVADSRYLCLKGISNLRNGKTEPKLESIIEICIAMKLQPIVSKKLF